jgi:hypothetical protein
MTRRLSDGEIIILAVPGMLACWALIVTAFLVLGG